MMKTVYHSTCLARPHVMRTMVRSLLTTQAHGTPQARNEEFSQAPEVLQASYAGVAMETGDMMVGAGGLGPIGKGDRGGVGSANPPCFH